MLRPDSASRRDMITDHAIALIEEVGTPGVTFAALASRIGLTRQAIQLWTGSRRELQILVTATYCRRWQQSTGARASTHGALCLLPANDDEVRWTRVLLALEEQARVQPELDEPLADLRAAERDLLVSIHPDLRHDDGTVRKQPAQLLLATLAGLRTAVCRPTDPLAFSEARETFWAECTRLAGPQADWLSPSAPWRPSRWLAC